MKPAMKPPTRRRPPKRAAVLVATLVTLALTLSLVLTMLQGSVARRDHLRRLHLVRQAEALLVAGRDRAIARMAAARAEAGRGDPRGDADDGSYAGETWRPEVVAAGGSTLSARVDIAISTDDLPDGESRRMLEVVVVYPADVAPERSVRRSDKFPLSAPDAG